MQRKLFEQGSMSMRQETTLGVALFVTGLVIAGVAMSRMGPEPVIQAQTTQQPRPDDNKPADSMPGGTRPTTPAPEPARPQNNEPATTGTAPSGQSPVAPALPPAPAEKVGPPVKER